MKQSTQTLLTNSPNQLLQPAIKVTNNSMTVSSSNGQNKKKKNTSSSSSIAATSITHVSSSKQRSTVNQPQQRFQQQQQPWATHRTPSSSVSSNSICSFQACFLTSLMFVITTLIVMTHRYLSHIPSLHSSSRASPTLSYYENMGKARDPSSLIISGTTTITKEITEFIDGKMIVRYESRVVPTSSMKKSEQQTSSRDHRLQKPSYGELYHLRRVANLPAVPANTPPKEYQEQFESSLQKKDAERLNQVRKHLSSRLKQAGIVYHENPTGAAEDTIASTNKFQQYQVDLMKSFDSKEDPIPLTGPNACKLNENILITTGIDLDQDLPSTTFRSRNLVMGIASNIDSRNFAIFCGSLRVSHVDATAIIFVNSPVSKEYRRIANAFDIILLVYDQQQLEPAFLRNYHPSTLRWILFDWFFMLENGRYAASFDRILALDVRDSAFQADPFQYFDFQVEKFNHQLKPVLKDDIKDTTEGMNETTIVDRDSNILYVFGENRAISINQCSWNRKWIEDSFGFKVLQMIGEQPISCSGISMGGAKRMIHYFNLMSQVMLNNFPCLPSSKFPTCERNGVDQGVHNVLLHLRYLEPVIVQYADIFPIVNLQSSPELMMSTTENAGARDLIYMPMHLFSEMIPYAVVHQYDRDSVFQLKLGKKYLPSINWDSPVADWAETETCTSNFGVIFGMDFLQGKCDIGSVRGLTPASCCDACVTQRQEANHSSSTLHNNLSLKRCTSFTYSKGICYLKDCPLLNIQNTAKVLEQSNMKSVLDVVTGYLNVDI